MARKTNIVSFEDARTRAGTRSRARSGARSASRSATRSTRYDHSLSLGSETRHESQGRQAFGSGSSQGGGRNLWDFGLFGARASEAGLKAGSGADRETDRGADEETARKARPRAERGGSPGAERGGSRSKRSDDRRRKRAKERADRLFDRQIASDSTTEPEEGAPRAAVYEGKMGSSHRKSARMQRSSSAGAASAKVDPAGWVAKSGITARTLKVATGVLCAVLVCTFLYVPAQQYYQAQREHERLEAEYSIIEKRNDVLDVQNDILASDAGLEDAVRQKYGYVKLGEQTAVVTGLSESATDTSRDGEDIEANVLAGSVKSPDEWYTPLLDAFFGVE